MVNYLFIIGKNNLITKLKSYFDKLNANYNLEFEYQNLHKKEDNKIIIKECGYYNEIIDGPIYENNYKKVSIKLKNSKGDEKVIVLINNKLNGCKISNIAMKKINNNDDIKTYPFTNELSILIIDKKASDSHIKHNENYNTYFKGYCIDHNLKSVIFGINGINEFQLNNKEYLNPLKPFEVEGSYILCRWNNDTLTFNTDVLSMYKANYYASNEIFIISDSIFLISEFIKILNIKREINHQVAVTNSVDTTANGSIMNSETIINNIFALHIGSYLKVSCKNNSTLNIKCIRKSFNKIFSNNQSYKISARKYIENTFLNALNLFKYSNSLFKLGLSGGCDSRFILSIFLKSEEIMKKIQINTRDRINEPQKINDYEVVKILSKKYNFCFNEKFKKSNDINNTIHNTLGYWILNNCGKYGLMYLLPSYCKHPSYLNINGVGEFAHYERIIRKKEDKISIDNILYNKIQYLDFIKTNKPNFYGLNYHNLNIPLNATLEQKKEFFNSFKKGIQDLNLNIDDNFFHALLFYKISTNGNYHITCKNHGSVIIYRPLSSIALYNLYLSNDYPFTNNKDIWPCLTQDLTILVNSELASEVYDSDYKNLSKDYIKERLIELGGPIDFESLKTIKYKKYGSINDMLNGPCDIFFDMLTKYSWREEAKDRISGQSPYKLEIKNMILSIYNDMDVKYKEIYKNLLESAINKCSDKITPVAFIGYYLNKFLMFLLVD